MKAAGYLLEGICWAFALVCTLIAIGNFLGDSWGYGLYALFIAGCGCVFGLIMRYTNHLDALDRRERNRYTR